MSLSAPLRMCVCVACVLQGSHRRHRFAAACKMVCGMQFVMQPSTDPASVAAPSAAFAAAAAVAPAFYTAVA